MTNKQNIEEDGFITVFPEVVEGVWCGPDFQIVITDERVKEWGAPKYESEDAAAVDLRALLPEGFTVINIEPGETLMVRTGIKLWIRNPGFCGIIVPRSSVGGKRGLVLANGTGVIDADYQGELTIPIWNRSGETQYIDAGERICQMLIMPVHRPTFTIVNQFANQTKRGEGGFGSTGRGL